MAKKTGKIDNRYYKTNQEKWTAGMGTSPIRGVQRLRRLLRAETGYFKRYDFTVRKDKPPDRVVAGFPEMLGKIFE